MFSKFSMRSSYCAARSLTVPVTSFVAIVLLVASLGVCADVYWTLPAGQSGNWSDALNWGGTQPTSNDTAYIVNGGTVAITLSGEVCTTLSLGNSAGSGNVQMTSGSLSSPTQYIGYSGAGTFAQFGGTNSASTPYLGSESGSSGTYNLSGGILSSYQQYVGYSGTGNFTQSGGTNSTIQYIWLGYNTGGNGTYSLTGGQMSTISEIVGSSGIGNFTQSGGTNSTINHVIIGQNAGSSGSYSLSENGLLSPKGTLAVGGHGTGTFLQSGGTNSPGMLALGESSVKGTGIYSLTGGVISSPSQYVGYSGTGTFTQSGGTNTVPGISGIFCLGYYAGSSGTYNLSGGMLILPSLNQGSGTAVFNFSGGIIKVIRDFSTNVPMTLGTSGGGATFDTAGYTLTLAGSLSGPGSLTKIGNGTLFLPTSNTYSGNTVISSGSLALGNTLALQQSTLEIGGSGGLSFRSLTSATLGGLSGPGTLNLSNTASVAVTLSVGNNNASTTYAGALGGAGSLTKIGIGTLTLAGSNSYSGATTINTGSLIAGAVNTLSTNSAVTINGGLLDLTAGSQSIASLTVTNGGQLNLKIGNLLQNLGTSMLNGTLNLSGTAAGSTIKLMSYLSLSGSFTTISGIPTGYRLAYNPTELDLISGLPNNSILSASSSSLVFGRVMLNHIPTNNITIGLSGGTSATGFSSSASGGVTALANGNGPGAIPPSGSVTVGLINATGGYSGTVQVQNSGDAGDGYGPSSASAGKGNAQGPISISVTGTVVANRMVTSSSASFGLVHRGALLNQGIALSTTGSDSQYTRVTVANGSDGFLTINGGSNATFNSALVTDNRVLSGTAGTAGVFNGTVTLTTSREGLTGESPINVPVNYSVQVFSGSGVWNGNSSLWSATGNWTDSNGSGIHAAPGTFAGFANTDTATFNGSGSVTAIDLTGTSPSLKALSFSNSSYTLSGSSLTLNSSTGTATLTVSSGTQTINMPTTLASNANFAINGGALLLNSTISGSGGFTKSGAGRLTLPEANTLSRCSKIT
ncbi:MAG: autotransporter-associated beta strand repeat-containing protein [Planctomycetota bacterium]